jgi:hypothetical protein
MSVLSSFLAEIMEQDPETPCWRQTQCLFTIIDAARDPEGIELRRAMEEIIQRDLPLRDRAHALIPLLRPHPPEGGTLH